MCLLSEVCFFIFWSRCSCHCPILVIRSVVVANLLQFCLTLCNLIDCQLAGSCARGILQASILEWVVMSSSRGSYWHKDQTQVPWSAGGFFTVWAPRDLCTISSVQLLSRVQLLATPWTAAYQTPPSMGFSKQEYWSGVPLPSPSNSLEYLNLTDT